MRKKFNVVDAILKGVGNQLDYSNDPDQVSIEQISSSLEKLFTKHNIQNTDNLAAVFADKLPHGAYVEKAKPKNNIIEKTGVEKKLSREATRAFMNREASIATDMRMDTYYLSIFDKANKEQLMAYDADPLQYADWREQYQALMDEVLLPVSQSATRGSILKEIDESNFYKRVVEGPMGTAGYVKANKTYIFDKNESVWGKEDLEFLSDYYDAYIQYYNLKKVKTMTAAEAFADMKQKNPSSARGYPFMIGGDKVLAKVREPKTKQVVWRVTTDDLIERVVIPIIDKAFLTGDYSLLYEWIFLDGTNTQVMTKGRRVQPSKDPFKDNPAGQTFWENRKKGLPYTQAEYQLVYGVDSIKDRNIKIVSIVLNIVDKMFEGALSPVISQSDPYCMLAGPQKILDVFGAHVRNNDAVTWVPMDFEQFDNHISDLQGRAESILESKLLLKQSDIDMLLIHNAIIWGSRYMGDVDQLPLGTDKRLLLSKAYTLNGTQADWVRFTRLIGKHDSGKSKTALGGSILNQSMNALYYHKVWGLDAWTIVSELPIFVGGDDLALPVYKDAFIDGHKLPDGTIKKYSSVDEFHDEWNSFIMSGGWLENKAKAFIQYDPVSYDFTCILGQFVFRKGLVDGVYPITRPNLFTTENSVDLKSLTKSGMNKYAADCIALMARVWSAKTDEDGIAKLVDFVLLHVPALRYAFQTFKENGLLHLVKNGGGTGEMAKAIGERARPGKFWYSDLKMSELKKNPPEISRYFADRAANLPLATQKQGSLIIEEVFNSSRDSASSLVSESM